MRSSGSEVSWPEAMAEVLECRYDVRAGRAIAFGLPTKKHFRIRYNYRVGDRLLTGECFRDTPLAQGTLFPIRYDPDYDPDDNPDTPTRHNGKGSGRPQRVPLLAFGLAGSLLLSLAWLLLLRGCT